MVREAAVTFMLRGELVRRAPSPKKSPALSRLTSSWLLSKRHDTSPCLMM